MFQLHCFAGKAARIKLQNRIQIFNDTNIDLDYWNVHARINKTQFTKQNKL